MKNKIINKLFFIIFFSLSLNLFSQEIHKGILDLRNNQDLTSNCINLDGQWEFYWQKLLTPEDFKDTIISPDAYINIPGNWNKIKIDNKNLEDTGYATIRLTILTTDTTIDNISIFVPEFFSASKIWLNDELIGEVGKVGTSKQQAIGKRNYILNSIELQPGSNQIIIQYSNFNHGLANGVEKSIKIGPTEKIVNNFFKSIALYLISFGIMLIMSLYHFGLFIMRKKNIAALSFAILTLIYAIRNIFTSCYFIQFLNPDLLSWEMSIKISYWTFYLFIPTFVFYFIATFEEKRFKIINYIIYGVSAIYFLSTFFSSLFYTKILIGYQIFVILSALYLIFLLIDYVKQKKVGSQILLISFLLFFITGVHDVLMYNHIIKSVELFSLGLIIFTFGQSQTLARIFTNAFIQNEKLSKKLNRQNEHLQELVDKRNREIEKQKQDILQKNEELIVQKEELQAQKEAISEQKEIIEQHNSMINESIEYASSIQRAILPTSKKISLYFDNFIIYKPRDIVSGDFYWFSNSQPNNLYFAVGDCTGHGVPGAFLSLIGSYLLNNIFNEKRISDPKEALELLEIKFDKFLNKQSSRNIDGMDISILKFELNKADRFIFAGAKSNIIVFDKKTNELTRYKGARKSIGNLLNKATKEKLNFFNTEIPYDSDTIIYIYTDGIIHQNNPKRKKFGTIQFQETIKSIANRDMVNQKLAILKKLEDWQGESSQRDDITVIALRLII